MKSHTTISGIALQGSRWLSAILFLACSLTASFGVQAATGVPDRYKIDSSAGSEKIIVTANDRLEVSTQAAIDAINIVAVSALSDPNAGSVQVDPNDRFAIRVSPGSGFSGQATFTYRVRDIRGTSADTTVTLNFVASAAVLEAIDDNYVSSGDLIRIFPAENDIRPKSGVRIEILSQPASGNLAETGLTGLYTYTPPSDISAGGTVSFNYRLVLNDGTHSAAATVSIQLDPTLDRLANAGDDGAQRRLARVIQVACDANTNATVGATNAQLSQSCAALSALSKAGLESAFEEILLRQIGAQANSMKGAAAGQIKNISARLQELRTGVPGISLAGLQGVINGENLNFGSLIDDLVKGGSAGEESGFGRWGGFVTGTLAYGEGESRNKEKGFDVDGQEILAGVDYRFNKALIMGAALGYSTSETREDGGDTKLDVDGWNLSVYGNYYPMENWYVDWLFGYGESSIETRRTIAFSGISTNARGDTDGDSLSAALGTGYIRSHESWTFDTYTNVDYRSGSVDGYREINDAGLGLNIFSTTTDTFTARVGGRVSKAINYDFGVLIPQFELEWVKDFKNDAPVIEAELALLPQAGTFTLTNEEPDDSYGNFGLSVSGIFKNGIMGFVRYSSMFSKADITFETWQLGARMEFGGSSSPDIELFKFHDNQGVGADVFVGTTGVGVAVTLPVRYERLNVRALVSVLPYDTDRELDDLKYDIDLEMQSVGVLLDWHPMDGSFRVSGGFFSLRHDTTGTATPTQNVEIGGSTFTPDEVGTLHTKLDYSHSLAPYLGIGWGNAVTPDSKWSFSSELGLMFTSKLKASLEADSPLASSNPALKAKLDTEIAVEQARINREDLEDIKYWPFLSFGVAYHF